MSIATKAGYARILNARYESFAVAVAFESPSTGRPVTLQMIDLTKGVTVGQDFAQVPTVEPVATASVADLKALGIEPAAMVGVVLTMNGAEWQVRSYAPHPGPFGAVVGQVYFMLQEPVA
jgi:hypothetical protein